MQTCVYSILRAQSLELCSVVVGIVCVFSNGGCSRAFCIYWPTHDYIECIILYTLRRYFPKYIFSILLFPLPPMRNNARTLLACGHTRYGSKVQKGLEHNTKQVGGKAFKTVTVAIHTPNAYRTYLKHIIQPDDNYVRLSLKYHVEVDDIKRVRHSLPLRVLIYLCTYEWCVRVRVNIFFFHLVK